MRIFMYIVVYSQFSWDIWQQNTVSHLYMYRKYVQSDSEWHSSNAAGTVTRPKVVVRNLEDLYFFGPDVRLPLSSYIQGTVNGAIDSFDKASNPLERRTCEDHDVWSCLCLPPVRYLRASPGCMCWLNWTVIEYSPDLEGGPPNWTFWSLSQMVSLALAWIYSSESQGALAWYIASLPTFRDKTRSNCCIYGVFVWVVRYESCHSP